MKLIVMAAGLVATLSASLEAQTGLTIYSGGRVLVRRTVAVAVPQGTSTHVLGLGSLTVAFYGRPVSTPTGPDFTLIEIPDTQYYTSSLIGGHPGIFMAQTRWIVAHRALRNVAYVGQVGDLVQNKDNGGDPSEWIAADSCMRLLEDPSTTLLPDGIPYGIAPGNHDIAGTGEHVFYDQYFGVGRFQGRSYYGSGTTEPTTRAGSTCSAPAGSTSS